MERKPLEQHYTLNEVAERLHLSKGKARQIFTERAGVIRIAARGRRATRSYFMLRIPESVVAAFLAECVVPPLPRSPAARQRHLASAGGNSYTAGSASR